MWCPGSGVVLDCIDSWSLPAFFVLVKGTIYQTLWPVLSLYYMRQNSNWFIYFIVLKKGCSGVYKINSNVRIGHNKETATIVLLS